MKTYRITLPIPHRCLSPNHTVGSIGQRMQKATQTKRYRSVSCNTALYALNGSKPRWKEATIQVTWYSKTARLIDRDNIMGYLKAAFDGLTDAGMLDDDRGVTHLPPIRLKDAKNPRVEIEISVAAPSPALTS